MEIFGIRLVGFTGENGRKLLIMLVMIAVVLTARFILSHAVRFFLSGEGRNRPRFWLLQGINLGATAILFLGILSIWFDDPTRLTTAVGLVTAGLAFALQKVITSIAGYFVILRSRVFTIGDRILMAGVRGDVISLGMVQTTIMEMGQPPGERPDDPSVWVGSRQYTGRIVTVTNDKVFQEPVFNYTRDFPYLWEEISVPISYKDDRLRAEEILLQVAERNTVKLSSLSSEAMAEMRRRYAMPPVIVTPRVYWRITDNWLELTVRFIVPEHGIRELKDTMSREILADFQKEGIGIASTTIDIVGFPIRIGTAENHSSH